MDNTDRFLVGICILGLMVLSILYNKSANLKIEQNKVLIMQILESQENK
jgi:hypothetical protein